MIKIHFLCLPNKNIVQNRNDTFPHLAVQMLRRAVIIKTTNAVVVVVVVIVVVVVVVVGYVSQSFLRSDKKCVQSL